MVVDDLDRLTKKKRFIRNGSLHLQARGHVRTYGGSLLASLLYLVGIGFSMTQPALPQPPADTSMNWARLIVISAIIGDLVIKMLNAGFYLRQRHLVIEMIEQEADVQPRQPNNARFIIEEDGSGTLVSPVDLEHRDGDGY